MFERLKRLFDAKKIGEPELEVAVSKGWITTKQKTEILTPKKTK